MLFASSRFYMCSYLGVLVVVRKYNIGPLKGTKPNLYHTTKLEPVVETTFNMYTSVSFLSLAAAGCVEMFASGYSSKEKEILKRPT